MAEKNDGGDKTELPTPKRLQDARKKGDVAKSKDVSAAGVTLLWLILFAMAGGYGAKLVSDFAQHAVTAATSLPFNMALEQVSVGAIRVLLILAALTLIPIAVVGTLMEGLQVGPIATTEKLKPSLDKMNPIEGLKRMFGKDGLVEMVKTLFKAALVIFITVLVIKAVLPELGGMLVMADWTLDSGAGQIVAQQSLSLTYSLTLKILGWTVLAFIGVAILDRVWVKHSFIKKMMMSRRDIKQEYKNDEGDPHIKQHRRQMHQEWANSNAVGSAGDAAALLVNPTHLAIAIDYDKENCPVPVIAAKGEGALAAAMRAAAEDNQVPIIRHVATARKLWARGEIGEIVPEDMFDAVAEVILWAKRAREGQAPMTVELGDEARPRGAERRAGAEAGAGEGADEGGPDDVGGMAQEGDADADGSGHSAGRASA